MEEQIMAYYMEVVDFAKALNMKMAVVEVRAGETNKEAWKRHLKDHPIDAHAMIKVFNRPMMTRQAEHA
jgi:hypothetical protein